MVYLILLSLMWTVDCDSIQIAPNASEIIRYQQTVLDQVIKFLDRIQEKVRHSQDLIEIIKYNTIHINNNELNTINNVSNTNTVQKSHRNKEYVVNDTLNSTQNGHVSSANIFDESLKRNKTMIMQALKSIVVKKPKKLKALRTVKRAISTKLHPIESHSQTHIVNKKSSKSSMHTYIPSLIYTNKWNTHTRLTTQERSRESATYRNEVKEKIDPRQRVVPDQISDYDVANVALPEAMKTVVMYISSPKSASITTTELPPTFFITQDLINNKESTVSTTPVLDLPVPDPVTDYVDIFAEDQATVDSMLLRQGYASGTQTMKIVTLDRLQSEFQKIVTLKDIPLPTQPTQFRSEIYAKMNSENVGYFSAGLWKLLKLIELKPYRIVKEVIQWLPHVLYRIPFGQFRSSVMLQTIEKTVNGVRMFTFDQIRDYAKHVAYMISYRKQRPQKDMNFLYNMLDILLSTEQGEAIIDVLTEFRDYPNHCSKKSGFHLCEAIVDAFILSVIRTASSKTDHELKRITNLAMGVNRMPVNSYGNNNFRPKFQQPYRNRRLNNEKT